MHFAQDNNLRFVLTSHAKFITLQHDTCFFTERVWCRLHPEGADWGERLQHVRISQVEAWEAADVCGSERPGEADERKENPKEEHSHTFSSNCCVNLCTRLERDNMKLWKCEVYNSEKWEISHLIKKKKRPNTVMHTSGLFFSGRWCYLCFHWHRCNAYSFFSFLFFLSVPNSLQLD